MNTRKIFKDFLKENGAYDNFQKEVTFRFRTVDNYLKFQHEGYPGYFLTSAFSWPASVTQPKKEAYSYWSSLNFKWWDYLKENNIPDKTEIVKRSF